MLTTQVNLNTRLIALRLAYHGETSVPVEIEGFTTAWASDKSLATVPRI